MLHDLLERNTTPSDRLIADVEQISGDVIILGVGGKMGGDLARLLANASRAAGVTRRVLGVSRFTDEGVREMLEREGITTIAADLLDDSALRKLPTVPNVIYMAGAKFGTAGAEHYTWAMNAYLPGRVCEHFRDAHIVAFSTGNVYPYVEIDSGGCTENTPPDPVGEYGQSCLGRERVFEHFSRKHGRPMLLLRLNYANDFRYGIIHETARAVADRRSIDLTTGYVNLIWQTDANEAAIRSLLHCASPPTVLNVTGAGTVSIRRLATRFGERWRTEPIFEGGEASTALLSNAARAHGLLGPPRTSLDELIDLVATWIESGGESLNKPTHYQTRNGVY